MAITLGLFVIVVFFAFSKAYRSPRAFLIFMLAAGIIRFGGNVGDALGGATNLSSLWLLSLILLGVVAAIRSRLSLTYFTKAETIYLFFLGWCVISILRSDNYLFGLRMFLKLFYPFLVMWLARNIINSEDMGRALMRWVMIAAFVAYLLVGGLTQILIPQVTWAASKYIWAVAAFANYAALMSILAFVCWRYFKQRRYLIFALLLASNSTFIGVRTGLIATALGVCLFAWMEYRRRALPWLLCIGTALVAVVCFVPEFQEKMFVDSSGLNVIQVLNDPASLSFDQINSSGRFEMWSTVLERFYEPNPALGSGLGSTQEWFYAGAYGKLRAEHSEFVRLLADTGFIGLGLYLLAIITAMASVWRTYKTTDNRLVYYLAIFSFCSFPTYVVCMAFDNVINYTLCAGQYPFAFAGIVAAAAAPRRVPKPNPYHRPPQGLRPVLPIVAWKTS